MTESTPRQSAERTWRHKLTALVVSLVLALFVAEIAVRLFVNVRNVGPTLTVYDPVYLKRLKKNFVTETYGPEFTMRISTNSLGFRGPEPPDPCRQSLVFVGDSFCMGYGVSDGEEYPRLVGQLLTERLGEADIPVINEGIGATGNGHWIKFLGNDAEKFDPRFVVLQASSNDFSENGAERLYSLDDEGSLVELEIPRPSWVRNAQAWVEAIPGISRSHLVALARQAALAWHRRPDPVPKKKQPSAGLPVARSEPPPFRFDTNEELTFALIERSIAMCEERGWPCLVLSVNVRGLHLERLRGIVESHGVQFVVAPTRSKRPDLYFHVDGHWNTVGHRFMAEKLSDDLLANEVFSMTSESVTSGE